VRNGKNREFRSQAPKTLLQLRNSCNSCTPEVVPRSWVIALAVMVLVYFFTCGTPRLFDQIDGQYAGAAREMMARGDWLTPTQDGVPRLQKPPLVYWCEALSMSVFGVNEFAARYPVALAMTGWFLATGLIARRVVGTWSAGLAGALTLAMFTGTFFFTHLVMPEPFLGCLMALSLLFPDAIRVALPSREGGHSWVGDDGVLLLAWFLVVALLISFANIQDYYLMIVWTPIAIWIAWVVTRNAISFQWPVVVGLLGASGLVVALFLGFSPSSRVDPSRPGLLVGDTILNVFQVLPPSAWKGIVPLLFLASASALAVGILVFLFNRNGKSEYCLAGFALLMAAIFAIGTRCMQLVEEELSSAKIAEIIDSRDRPKSIVIAQGDPNEKTTLFFYLHRPILWVDGHPDIEFATRSLGIGREHYLTREQVAKVWREAEQVFLLIEGNVLAEWEEYLGHGHASLIGTCGSRVILVNR
jgi:hypothetical protein